jgi:hypothetical protein
MSKDTKQNDIDWDQESSGGDLYKWEKPGQKVTGVYMNKRSVNTKLGAMIVYDLLTATGQIAVPGTKSLKDQMAQYPANGSLIVQMEFTEEVKGNFPNPFKKFTVRVKQVSEEVLEKLGIKMFAEEAGKEPKDGDSW